MGDSTLPTTSWSPPPREGKTLPTASRSPPPWEGNLRRMCLSVFPSMGGVAASADGEGSRRDGFPTGRFDPPHHFAVPPSVGGEFAADVSERIPLHGRGGGVSRRGGFPTGRVPGWGDSTLPTTSWSPPPWEGNTLPTTSWSPPPWEGNLHRLCRFEFFPPVGGNCADARVLSALRAAACRSGRSPRYETHLIVPPTQTAPRGARSRYERCRRSGTRN